MNKELREAVARAILKTWHIHPWELADPFHQDNSLREADAAISIIRPAVLEEAAKQCSVQIPLGDDEFTEGYRLACEENSRNIRSLAKEGK